MLLHQVKPCLMVNKLDRLITELKLSPSEAAQRLTSIVAHANMIWSAFDSEHFMREGYEVIKTFHVKDAMSLKRLDEYNVSAFLFDTYSQSEKGGSGRTFDWGIIEDRPYVHEKLFLAGGLNVTNVVDAIKAVKPFAVDVASGVESSPGVKDPKLLKEFISLVKKTP